MTENKRSLKVSAAAWFFTLLGGCHSVRAAYDNLTLADMFSSPSFMLGLASSTLPVNLPPLARLVVANIHLVFAVYLLASLGVCVAGIGLLLRKAWALTAVRRIFYAAAACCLVVFLFPWLLVPRPLVHEGIELAPEFNSAVGTMKTQLRIAAALAGAVLLLTARWFARAGIREEFGSGSPEAQRKIS